MSATCTVTVAATTSTTGATDALFVDAALVSTLLRNAANSIEVTNNPVQASGSVTININNNAYAITWTTVNT